MPLPASLGAAQPFGALLRFAAVLLLVLLVQDTLVRRLAHPFHALMLVSGAIPVLVVLFVLVPMLRAKRR